MIEKEKILEAWIMVEHLSEGDIRIKDTSPLTPDGLQEQDFHALLRHEMEKKKITSKKNGGIVVYFDIFSFREVVSILREQYRLEPTNEDIQFGNKFSFALYFDKDLNFLPDMTFFTESAYIRYFKEVPNQEAFREFEDELKQSFTQDFDGTAASPKKFNGAFQKELQRYGTGLKNCRMQVLSSVETEGTNLHSFFIGDLEKAKETDTDNLRAYLYGQSGERVNLDSKNSSPHFNPGAFEEILRPENYPLGRFPSKTKFALSLMQQVAVNLSTGADPQPVRSVNGPPGTGKTTLLKDIFAQLVVQQACDIAKLSEHTIAGTEETVYFNSASIGVLPARITENHIVVASSNNGAVQNIVNELPLCQGIEETLLEDLKQADYFREISNAKVSSQWKKDENGKNREELTLEAGKGEENRWGVFSLEGGRSDNMTNILTHIKHMCKYLEEEYLPPAEDVYKAFLKQYEQVRSLRAQVQAAADSIQARQGHAQRLEQARAAYQVESARRKKGWRKGFGSRERPAGPADSACKSCSAVWRRCRAGGRPQERAGAVWSSAWTCSRSKSPDFSRRRANGSNISAGWASSATSSLRWGSRTRRASGRRALCGARSVSVKRSSGSARKIRTACKSSLPPGGARKKRASPALSKKSGNVRRSETAPGSSR